MTRGFFKSFNLSFDFVDYKDFFIKNNNRIPTAILSLLIEALESNPEIFDKIYLDFYPRNHYEKKSSEFFEKYKKLLMIYIVKRYKGYSIPISELYLTRRRFGLGTPQGSYIFTEDKEMVIHENIKLLETTLWHLLNEEKLEMKKEEYGEHEFYFVRPKIALLLDKKGVSKMDKKVRRTLHESFFAKKR